MRVRFTRSSWRHRIGRAHAMHVINLVEPTVSTNERGEAEYLWVGEDDRGVMLEIAAVVVEDDVLLVLHVMPRRYRSS
ncbi:MAG: hypothetical protein H0V07_03830 [Propionibacteriales bacterium]|nr:hypothetical protein [Propionibacteriales bacterium]